MEYKVGLEIIYRPCESRPKRQHGMETLIGSKTQNAFAENLVIHQNSSALYA